MNRIFRDEYTDFTFNGVRSSQMKVWITNNRDLQFRLTPEFTDTFIAPSFSNTQILNNTNITKSTFSLKCIAIDITMQDWRAIQGWLSPTAVGRLSFDFNIGTYYEAKIDKGISGTTFVKGGGDRNISDRYIIEFTVGFTTVGDYAALGEVNVGILGKNFKDIIIGEDTTDDITDDVEYKIESVSNNRYFMPSIIKETNENPPVYEATKLNGKTVRFYHEGTDGVRLAYLTDMSTKVNKTEYIEDDEGNYITYNDIYYNISSMQKYRRDDNDTMIEDDNGIYIQLPDTSYHNFSNDDRYNKLEYLQYGYNYELKTSVEENVGHFIVLRQFKHIILNGEINNQQVSETKYPVKKEKDSEKKYADINFIGESLYVVPLISDVVSFPQQNESSYIINNTGSYDMYPYLLINDSNFTIKKNSKNIYNYELKIPLSVEIDCKNGFVLSQGQPIENISYKAQSQDSIYEYVVTSSFENNGILNIETGNPQLLKFYYDSSEVAYFRYEDQGVVQRKFLGKIYKFKSSEKLYYDYKNYISTHIFHNVVGMQGYNTLNYPVSMTEDSTDYDVSFIGSTFTTEALISYNYNKENDCYDYSIFIPQSDPSKELFSKHPYYLSICNYDVLEVHTNSSSNGKNFIYLQTRDAF